MTQYVDLIDGTIDDVLTFIVAGIVMAISLAPIVGTFLGVFWASLLFCGCLCSRFQYHLWATLAITSTGFYSAVLWGLT